MFKAKGKPNFFQDLSQRVSHKGKKNERVQSDDNKDKFVQNNQQRPKKKSVNNVGVKECKNNSQWPNLDQIYKWNSLCAMEIAVPLLATE